jgi:RNA polymerase sigma factor (sigma-70 family)
MEDDWKEDFAELMRRAKARSEEAALELVARYGDLVLRTVRRVLDGKCRRLRLRRQFDSVDLAQMTWDAFFEQLRSGGLGELDDPVDVAAYLVRVAENKVFREAQRLDTQKRGGGREVPFSASAGESELEIPDGHTSRIEELMAQEELDHVLDGRPEKEREMLRLQREEGLKCDQIGEILGRSASQVRRVLRAIYEKLRARLRGDKE